MLSPWRSWAETSELGPHLSLRLADVVFSFCSRVTFRNFTFVAVNCHAVVFKITLRMTHV